MPDLLKVLTEASFDNLFTLTGLALIVLAIIGSITGKVSLSPGGRLAGGVVGGGLVALGIWMHSGHGLRIVSLVVSAPQNTYEGSCPADLPLQGVIDGEGAGTVIYSFEYSDGTSSPASSVDFDKTTARLVSSTWKVHESAAKGWARIKTISPQQVQSPNFPLSIHCRQDSTASASTPEASGDISSTTGEVGPPPGVAAESDPPKDSTAQTATTAPQKPTKNADFVEILESFPPTGKEVPRGQTFPFHLVLRYNLVSRDSAVLAISVVEIMLNKLGCGGAGGMATDAIKVPLTRGARVIKTSATWSGDTPLANTGHVYGRGFVTFVPSLWDEKGTFIKSFGVFSAFCYPFGS
jgi:hypothetical protein